MAAAGSLASPVLPAAGSAAEAVITVAQSEPQDIPAPTSEPLPAGQGGGVEGLAAVDPSSPAEQPADSGQPAVLPAEEPASPATASGQLLAAAAASGDTPRVMYYTQAGDTLTTIANRFNVSQSEIVSAEQLDATGFLDPDILLMIPPVTASTSPADKVLPDSEFVFSPSAIDFDVNSFVVDAGGYLSTYREYLNSTGWISGAGIIRKLAVDNSINPKLLLSLLQYRSNWVFGQPADQKAIDYPMGFEDQFKKGLYAQLNWAVSQLSYSYYGWRSGAFTAITFPDGSNLQAAPVLNSGSYAMQYLFAQFYQGQVFSDALYGNQGFMQLYQGMFGDPWIRAATYEPLYPPEIKQPELILPIEPNDIWAFTGGPHSAWGKLGARAALDFAPSDVGGCAPSDDWVLAAASGVVVRSAGGAVVLDLDGDGNEQTGWNLLYMHIATEGRPEVGQWLDQGQRLGHPSCEGGFSTGTHFHIARKFNGEWILADGPLSFNMDGWVAHAAPLEYKGSLQRGRVEIISSTSGASDTYMTRDGSEPQQ